MRDTGTSRRWLGRVLLPTVLGLAVVALCGFVSAVASHPGVLFAPLALGSTMDMDAIAGGLKINYQEPMFNQVVTHSKLVDLFNLNSNVKQGEQGKYIELSNMFGAPEGGGWRSENANLPVPGNPTFVNGRVRLKKYLHVVQMTRNAMANAKKSKAAFADWGDMTLKPAAKVIAADLDRVAIGFGAGCLCRIDGTPSTTMPIDAPYGLANNTKGWLPGLRRGMKVVFSPNIDGVGLRSNGQSSTILSVTKSGNSGGGTLSLDRIPADALDNDYLFRGDDYGSNAPEAGIETEAMGLLGHIDDGTILDTHQNISRGTYDEWKSQAIDASAAPYSGDPKEILFLRMADDASELGGGEVSHFVTTMSIFRGAFDELKSTGGYGAHQDPGNLKGGAKGIKYWIGDRMVELRAFPKMPVGRIFGIDASTLYRYHLKSGAFEWVDWTGSMFHQVGVGGAVKDAVWFYGRVELEYGCSAPQQNVVATGIDETQW